MRRWRAVQTFSSVTAQERSPVCGLVVMVIPGQYSTRAGGFERSGEDG